MFDPHIVVGSSLQGQPSNLMLYLLITKNEVTILIVANSNGNFLFTILSVLVQRINIRKLILIF